MPDILSVNLKESYTGFPEGMLGEIVETRDGRRFMFVENAEGATVAYSRALKWSTRGSYEVAYATSFEDRVCGVVATELGSGLTITDGDGFWMQIAGECEIQKGDGDNVAAGDWVIVDDDSDQGKTAGLDHRSVAQLCGPSSFKTEAGLTLTGSTAVLIEQSSNKELRLAWAAGDTNFVKMAPIVVPKDFSRSTDDISIIAGVLQTGGTDTRTLDAEVYIQSGNAAFGADANPTAAAVAQSGSVVQRIEIDLTGESIKPEDVLDVQLSFTNSGSTDSAWLYFAGLVYTSTTIPGHAFARAVDAQASTDGLFTARLIEDHIRSA